MLFPSGAPCLKTAQLHGIDVTSIQISLPALGLITSLRLTGLFVHALRDDGYNVFRKALMALPLLHHLELQVKSYDADSNTDPIVLPTIQYMRLETSPVHLDELTCSFMAANLLVISLEGWDGQEYDIGMEDLSTLRFPSLEHLILTNIGTNRPFLDAYAQRFPNITRLTCQVRPDAKGCDIDYVLTPMCWGTQKYEYPDDMGPPKLDVESER
ncbi:hypothetical protein HWV62_37306 [Athelia sp. TMB]|nr:hypothetical protein HWV62_37306 [Athelia sp. TMB]